MTKKSNAPETFGFNVDLVGKQPMEEAAAIDWPKSFSELISSGRESTKAIQAIEQMQASVNKTLSVLHGGKSLREILEPPYMRGKAFLEHVDEQRAIFEKVLKPYSHYENEFAKWQALMNSPESQGLSALLVILEGAAQNPEVQKSKAALEILGLFQELLAISPINASSDEIMKPLIDQVEKSARSSMAGKNASKKNAALRDWVLQQWPKYKAKDYSKARFALWCVQNQPNKILGQIPSANQIARVWLKGK